MLQLELDELFTPELIQAFRNQWKTDPAIAADEAKEVLRALTCPRDDRERVIGKIVTALVGSEPDASAWLEALAVGSFAIRDNVSYAIGRVRESPAKFITRQRERIADLVNHPRAKGREADYRNAYTDALRLIVASTLLTQMRLGVAARAAIGPGWPIMTAVSTRCNAATKARLARLGSAESLQQRLAEAVSTVVTDYAAEVGLIEAGATRSRGGQSLPLTEIEAFFATEEELYEVLYVPADAFDHQRLNRIPSFLAPLEKTDSCQRSGLEDGLKWRMPLMSGRVETENLLQRQYLILAAAMRSVVRERRRAEAIANKSPKIYEEDFRVQQCIRAYVIESVDIPFNVPNVYITYLEEEVAYAFEKWGEDWVGCAAWRKIGYLNFAPTKNYADIMAGGYGVEWDGSWSVTNATAT